MKNTTFGAVLLAAILALSLAGCGGGSSTPTPDPDPGPTPAETQTAAIEKASKEVNTAVGALSGAEPTQAQIDAANTAIGGLQSALSAATDVSAANKAGYQAQVATAQDTVKKASATLAAMQKKDADDKAAAMAAMAAKLHAGISAPGGTGADTRTAGYAGTNDSQISVTIGTSTAVNLSEDKKTTVADNHGWVGKQYTDPAGGPSYEAVVYSNIKSTPGRKFGSAAVVTSTGDYEYQLVLGELTEANASSGGGFTPAKVDLDIDRTAGTETFKVPSPNPDNLPIKVSGSYHGVSGTYRCTSDDGTCTATVATTGFTLSNSGDVWKFMPDHAEDSVMDAPDTAYASYGWWLYTATTGELTASAFADYKGGNNQDEYASGIDDLKGTATYRGGAAGQYALASSTGGTNDAGHFTASATLTANFTSNTTSNAITGTIDNFTGADGETRDWSVKLNGSTISDSGEIGNATAGTEWTIGGTAAADAGNWSGRLYENGTDLIPQVATGTFYTKYGTDGLMVGGFGANHHTED